MGIFIVNRLSWRVGENRIIGGIDLPYRKYVPEVASKCFICTYLFEAFQQPYEVDDYYPLYIEE